jgi:hypothetical protein
MTLEVGSSAGSRSPAIAARSHDRKLLGYRQASWTAPKLGFPTPTAQWPRGEPAGRAHEILSSSAAGNLINLDFSRQMLAQHQSGKADLPANCGPSWFL